MKREDVKRDGVTGKPRCCHVSHLHISCMYMPLHLTGSFLPPPVLRGRAGVGGCVDRSRSRKSTSLVRTPTLTLPRSTGGGNRRESIATKTNARVPFGVRAF